MKNKLLSTALLAYLVLAGSLATAQNGPFSVTLTNPSSLGRTFKFDPKQRIPTLAFNCLTNDGTPRSFNCEFSIVELLVIGKKGALLATITPATPPAATPVISLKKSQSSDSKEEAGGSGSLDYRLVLRYRRIAEPAFPTTQYTISTGHVDHPSTPSELLLLHTFTDTPGKLPGPVQTYDFVTTLQYSGGSSPSLTGGDIRYIQIANPTTFEKAKSTTNLSDRAEAFIRFFMSVDLAH